MHAVIAWSGFLGAWLLVAGPLFQAAVDLDDQQAGRSGVVRAAERVGPQPRVSAWWWLLPPVAYVKQRRGLRDYQNAVFATLTADEVESFVAYSNLSTGWLMVSAGAFFIAIKESYEVVETSEWPTWLLAPTVLVMIVLCTTNTVVRVRRAHRMKDEAKTHPQHPATSPGTSLETRA